MTGTNIGAWPNWTKASDYESEDFAGSNPVAPTINMKTCPDCKESEPSVVFSPNKARRDGKQVYCQECQKTKLRKHYQDNKQYYYEKSKTTKVRNRKFLFDYLSTHDCVDCHETDPIVLTFDHVRGTKLFNLGEAVTNQYSLAKIKEEIMKCEVRCCNCHTRKTARDFGWYASFLQPSTKDVV